MAGWTKADYDTAYRLQVERRMSGGGPPPAEGRPPVFIHYHKFYQAPMLAAMWANVQPVLNILPADTEVILTDGTGYLSK